MLSLKKKKHGFFFLSQCASSTVLHQWHNYWLTAVLWHCFNIWHHVPEQTLKSWNKKVNRESLINHHEKTPEYWFVFNIHGIMVTKSFQSSRTIPFCSQYCWSPFTNIEACFKSIKNHENAFRKPLWACGHVVSFLTYVLSKQCLVKYIPKSV